MSADLPRWRPLTRAEVDAFGAVVVAQIGQWLDQWLSGSREIATSVHAVSAGTLMGPPDAAWSLTPWLRAEVHPALMTRLASRAVALSPGAEDAETGAVLAALAQEAGQGLRTQLAHVTAAVPQAPPVPWSHGGYRFEFDLLGLGAAVILWVACEHLWAQAGPSSQAPYTGMPMSVREALAMRSVTVDVRLGECRLRASDIWDLQSGDVLVTTRALAEPVMLEVIGAQGHRAVVARGRLGHHGTRLALSVTAMGAGA